METKVLKIRMQLISDVVFGNGESVPGGEDISVLRDKYGFPYYKGGTISHGQRKTRVKSREK